MGYWIVPGILFFLRIKVSADRLIYGAFCNACFRSGPQPAICSLPGAIPDDKLPGGNPLHLPEDTVELGYRSKSALKGHIDDFLSVFPEKGTGMFDAERMQIAIEGNPQLPFPKAPQMLAADPCFPGDLRKTDGFQKTGVNAGEHSVKHIIGCQWSG